MKTLRGDGKGVPGDADDEAGVEIGLAGGYDDGSGEEDEDDVEYHDPEENDVEVDVDAEDGDVVVQAGVEGSGCGYAEQKFMTLLRRRAAYSLDIYQGLSLFP